MEDARRQFEQLLKNSSKQAGERNEVKNVALRTLGSVGQAWGKRLNDEDYVILSKNLVEKIRDAEPGSGLNALRDLVIKEARSYFRGFRHDSKNSETVKNADAMADFFEFYFDKHLADRN